VIMNFVSLSNVFRTLFSLSSKQRPRPTYLDQFDRTGELCPFNDMASRNASNQFPEKTRFPLLVASAVPDRIKRMKD